MKKSQKIIENIMTNSDLQTYITQRKQECLSENSENHKKIGINKVGIANFGGIVSASSDFIDSNRHVIIENGLFNIVEITTGNIDEVYTSLFNKIKQVPISSIKDIANIVYTTVNEYFGKDGDGLKRLELLPDNDIGTGTLVDLKGKNLVACVERATLSQNLFKILGIDSSIKQSTIIIDDHEEGHAYNIIRFNEINYIYDSALPIKSKNENNNPIVGTISDGEYSKITHGSCRNGCRTQKMANGIIYDSSFKTLEEQFTDEKFSKKFGEQTLELQNNSSEKFITEKDMDSQMRYIESTKDSAQISQ